MSSTDKKPTLRRVGDLSFRLHSDTVTRYLSDETNPCAKEHHMSYQCLDDNAYEREKCSKHFLNYRHCRLFWHLVVRDRKNKGIKPFLPAPADRQQAKEDYKHVMPWQQPP